MIGIVTYQCCFCGEAIPTNSPDVGGLLYTTNIDKGEGSQSSQELYCHAACLSQRIHPDTKLYAIVLAENGSPPR